MSSAGDGSQLWRVRVDLFAEDAQVCFPKWGLATGKKQIGQLFTDFGGRTIRIDPGWMAA